MKKILLVIALLLSINNNLFGQEFSFITNGLKAISEDQLFSKPSPKNLDDVFYSDGTRTTLNEVLPLIMSGKLKPMMFVDEQGNYKALVVEEINNEDLGIDFQEIPENLKALGHSVGNKQSDTIVLYIEGGPNDFLAAKLFTSRIKTIVGSQKKFEDFLFVNVHHSHSLNPDIINGPELTFESAKQHTTETIEIVSSLIDYFKSMDKTVYVFGSSHGAFIVQDLISREGIIADGYLIIAGRLNMNKDMWKPKSEGKSARFDKEGRTVIAVKDASSISRVNKNKIQAASGYKQYTELLDDLDLTKVVYVYGKRDSAVGVLTNNELEFLYTHGATVIAGEGGHSDNRLDFVEIGLRILMTK
jgi:hypothetical protein